MIRSPSLSFFFPQHLIPRQRFVFLFFLFWHFSGATKYGSQGWGGLLKSFTLSFLFSRRQKRSLICFWCSGGGVWGVSGMHTVFCFSFPSFQVSDRPSLTCLVHSSQRQATKDASAGQVRVAIFFSSFPSLLPLPRLRSVPENRADLSHIELGHRINKRRGGFFLPFFIGMLSADRKDTRIPSSLLLLTWPRTTIALYDPNKVHHDPFRTPQWLPEGSSITAGSRTRIAVAAHRRPRREPTTNHAGTAGGTSPTCTNTCTPCRFVSQIWGPLVHR